MSDAPAGGASAVQRSGASLIGVAARWVVALVFLAAAAGKIELPHKFAEEIVGYRLAPLAAVNAIAYILPWLEVLLALSLLSGVWRRDARRLLLALLVFFTGLKVYAEAVGLHISCGCFGGSFAFLGTIFEGRGGIALNFGLLALIGLDFYSDVRRARSDRRPSFAS